jgi:hypothetical protein
MAKDTIDLFLMTDSKNAKFTLTLPGILGIHDKEIYTAKSDAHGGIHIDVKNTVVQASVKQLAEMSRSGLSSYTPHTDAFMANVTLDACAQSVMSPNSPADHIKINVERMIDIIGDELLTEHEPLWESVVGSIRKANPRLREISEKVNRNMSNGSLRIAKGVAFKHTTVFMNFISHEFEFDIIPTAYTHNVKNGGDVVIRFAGFRGGDFCQLVFSNRRWITIIGNENKDQITISSIFYNTRDQIERKIRLADTGFLQHIAETWLAASFNSAGVQTQPHRNIELVVYDMAHGKNDPKVIAETDTRYKLMLQKLRMLFDEREPADTNQTWVRVLREVYFGMGKEQGHIVSGRLVK